MDLRLQGVGPRRRLASRRRARVETIAAGSVFRPRCGAGVHHHDADVKVPDAQHAGHARRCSRMADREPRRAARPPQGRVAVSCLRASPDAPSRHGACQAPPAPCMAGCWPTPGRDRRRPGASPPGAAPRRRSPASIGRGCSGNSSPPAARAPRRSQRRPGPLHRSRSAGASAPPARGCAAPWRDRVRRCSGQGTRSGGHSGTPGLEAALPLAMAGPHRCGRSYRHRTVSTAGAGAPQG